MNTRSSLPTIVAVTAMFVGCNSKPDVATAPTTSQSPPAAHVAAASPAQNMPVFEALPNTAPLGDALLQAFEQKHSCQIPADYREFLLSSNGGFPSPDCVSFEEAGRKTTSDVFCFFAFDHDEVSLSMKWHQEGYAGRLPQKSLPIGRDSSGNLWLMSLREDDAGAIFFWDHGSYDTFDETDLNSWPKVATSFQAFRDSLVEYDSSADEGAVPSRYSLAKQAADGMARRDAGFTTRANPSFVWHCDCDDEGNVSMQFVQYEIHAVTTHTCGYSRLCAIKGLIEEGRTRLPE